jgi:hypothetical protein
MQTPTKPARLERNLGWIALLLLLGVDIVGEQATELVHIGLVAMMSNSGAELLNRTCFNYPTLGDLYKYATYEAMLKRDGIVADDNK